MRVSRLRLFGLTVSVVMSMPAAIGASTVLAAATDEYRPQYHFSAARNWINDPNGLVFVDGVYHLFYQYNPLGNRWGHMSCGHARSTDLVHWQELPVAIPEDARYMIFSGSIAVDCQNASGFGAGMQSPLVAVFTGFQLDTAGIQNQQLAYSLDHGMTWSKYAGNPVLDLGLRAFRDPKVFWHGPTLTATAARSTTGVISTPLRRGPTCLRWATASCGLPG